MEEQKEISGMLDLMIRPGFCVKENQIVYVNPAAENLLIESGTDIRPLLLTGAAEYAGFSGGCLYLRLAIGQSGCGAAVTRMGDCDVFLLDQESDDGALRALSLAARELRECLSNVMATSSHLFPPELRSDPLVEERMARLNRGLFQLHRLVNNMSDANHFASDSCQETMNISSFLAEVFEKAQSLLQHRDIRLTFQRPEEDIYCLADRNQLERAVLNILSNSVKFTPEGGRIEASLTRHGQQLRLSILDSGSGIAEHVKSSIFTRYLRQPGIEDGRHGIGLGMVLIRSAAANHGGAVLIDQPKEHGTRITMTLAIRSAAENTLRSSILRPDYAGGQDHVLLELSESLPSDLYRK